MTAEPVATANNDLTKRIRNSARCWKIVIPPSADDAWPLRKLTIIASLAIQYREDLCQKV